MAISFGRSCVLHAWVVLLSLGLMSTAGRAQTVVGVDPSTPTGSATAVNTPSSGFAFFIENASPPTAIVIDADTGLNSWKNVLTLDVHNAGLANGTVGSIRTDIQVGTFAPGLGVSAWTGWRETILSDNWEWVNGEVDEIATSPTPVAGLSTLLSNSNTTITFGFDPLTSGAEKLISKDIRYVGPDITPGAVVSVNLDIIANPMVPEPVAAVVLLPGFALVLLVSRRRCWLH